MPALWCRWRSQELRFSFFVLFRVQYNPGQPPFGFLTRYREMLYYEVPSLLVTKARRRLPAEKKWRRGTECGRLTEFAAKKNCANWRPNWETKKSGLNARDWSSQYLGVTPSDITALGLQRKADRPLPKWPHASGSFYFRSLFLEPRPFFFFFACFLWRVWFFFSFFKLGISTSLTKIHRSIILSEND